MAPTPEFLPGESHEQRNLLGYGPQGRKESDPTEVTAQHGIMNCEKQKLRKQPWGG